MDLLLSTLSLERVGCIEDENVVPVLGPSDREGSASGLTLTIEVYQSKDGKWTLIQQRSPTVQHRSPQYTQNLLRFIQDSQFATVIVLASADGARRIDIQLAGTPVRYIGSPALPSALVDTLQSLAIRPLETIPVDKQDQRALAAQKHGGHELYEHHVPSSQKLSARGGNGGAGLADKMQEIRLETTGTTTTTETTTTTTTATGAGAAASADQQQARLEKVPRIPGGGFARRLHSLCQEQGVAVVTVVVFAMEGDNAPDAVFLANVVNAVWKLHVPKAAATPASSGEEEGWKFPRSWNSLYGNDYHQDMY
ncbi:Proteasome assembly chaperone 2 [Actinomortierella ambigua]|uniref:Proteasome assembly chaperone 2 n=1 Tax=Actinomortierella ambigua TaxID=1343610 RepID=A0A9P6U763_9FUNG|nr:Proteasome assembly chaperone 2 [Actinomortierella ambigua]